MGNRKGIIYEANERLDALLQVGLGTSRYEVKQARRAAGYHLWTDSSGLIHSHGTRNAYQEHVMHFIQWARTHYAIRRLDVLDARADEVATEYLSDRLIQGRSPYTVQAERSALRLFFSQQNLADAVVIPARKRENITRSRGAALRDRDFQPANWQPLLGLLAATGLRRAEVTLLQVEDIEQGALTGKLEVVVKAGHGKGGRPRRVPVLPGQEPAFLALIEGRAPQERVFARVPSHLDIHALRRQYAQAYYCLLSGRVLPPATGRLKPSDYDEAAVLEVSRALGHNRKDIVTRHYLR
jgi:integrase